MERGDKTELGLKVKFGYTHGIYSKPKLSK